jgi:hypothetical protein
MDRQAGGQAGLNKEGRRYNNFILEVRVEKGEGNMQNTFFCVKF